MSTNHKPEIPDGSEAIWDRLRLIPFTQRFDGKKADTALPVKLREELPGVLAWAVRGCVAWVENGLGSAKAVESATAAYRAETDLLEQFFQDRCYFYPEGRVTKKALYQAWEAWCDEMGEPAGTQTQFTRTMGERGVVKNVQEDNSDKTPVLGGVFRSLRRKCRNPKSPANTWVVKLLSDTLKRISKTFLRIPLRMGGC
jgi:phage/plasmid-associated DNA primase